MSTVDASSEIVTWARWAVTNKSWFNYAETRPFQLFQPTAARHITNDCSATVTLYYWLAGAPDPNGPTFNYSGYGNTDSLVANGSLISDGTATQPSDLVIYYDNGVTVHTAIIVEPGSDPYTVSHGSDNEPAYIYVSQDGRPHQFFRFDTQKPAPIPIPTEDDPLLVLVQNPNNKGWAVLNLADGTFRGFANADLLSFWEANGIKKAVKQPTVAEWSHFSQAGTI